MIFCLLYTSGKEVQRQSIDQIVDKVMSLGEGTKIQILAPVIRGKKGEHKKVKQVNYQQAMPHH